MLLRLLGAGAVFCAGTAIGWQLAQPLRRRPEELRSLAAGLALLETEIAYGATPLPAALERAASAGPPAAALYGRAAALCRQGRLPCEALEEALAELYANSSLTAADRQALSLLARVLGASDRADQARHLRLCRERLAAAEAQAEAERQRHERVYRQLGLAAGAAAAILLL